MKHKSIITKLIVMSLTVFLYSSLSTVSFAIDVRGKCDPPPYSAGFSSSNGPSMQFGVMGLAGVMSMAGSESDEGTIWREDIDSYCEFGETDHFIPAYITVDPQKVSSTTITLTCYDVDYNDPQGCEGGPEVDYLYINNHLIGQLQGANDSWSTNTFSFPSGYLVEGENLIYIDVDAPYTECWCMAVGYIEISGNTGFRVVNHTPGLDEKNVKWDNPDITLEFGSEVNPSTVNGNTIKLEYRNQNGIWVEENIGVNMISDFKVRVSPSAWLKDGIRYRVRVVDGPNGVLDKDGGELSSPFEWYFWTMLDLEGQTSKVYEPNISKDKTQITWFNAIRNESLVPGKRVANRVYVLWDARGDVFDDDEVTEFEAKVSFEVNGVAETKNNYTIKRPDLYSPNEKKMANNTINFYHTAGVGSQESYRLTIEPWPQAGQQKKFEQTAAAQLTGQSSPLEFNVYACEMAGWFHGVNQSELKPALDALARGAAFTEQCFPVVSCTYNDKGIIESGSGGFDMQETETKFSKWWGGDVRFVNTSFRGTSTTETEEIRAVMNHLASLKAPGQKFIVGIVPDNALPGATVAQWKNAILIKSGAFNERMLAREIGSIYRLDNSAGSPIEGFRVATKANKSCIEGNSESNALISFMNEDPQITDEPAWILPGHYKSLMNQLIKPSKTRLRIADAGDFIVVQGYIGENGTIDMILPTYRVNQRYLDAPNGSGRFTIKVLSEDGTVLGSPYAFDTEEFHITRTDGSLESMDSFMFAFTIPYYADAYSLVIEGPGAGNTKTISKADVGELAPVVNFVTPADGAAVSGNLDVTWSGTDDGGKVYYRLEYSADGTSWIPVSSQLADTTRYQINTTLLSAGEGHLALIAYDGFNSTREEIDITINNSVTVERTIPLHMETEVSEEQEIAAYFVNRMNGSTINTNTFTVSGGGIGKVAGQILYDSEAQKATFICQNALAQNTAYTVHLAGGPNGVKDMDGRTLAANYEWSFTTGRRIVNPQVVSVSPARGGTNVPVNTLLQVTFSHEMDGSTVDESSFIVADTSGTPVSGTAGYMASTKSASFSPQYNLAQGTTYTATLTTAVTDLQGSPLEIPYSWTFTTGQGSSQGVRIIKVSREQAVDDTNDDGLYDKLIISFEVEILSPGEYNLNAQMRDKNGEDIGWASKIQYFSESGIYIIDLEFKGHSIASHGIDGPFEVANISIANTSNSNIQYSFAQPYQTYSYQADEFYSCMQLSNIPDIAIARNLSLDNIINLENYASHADDPVSDLDYQVFVVSNQAVHVVIDNDHNLDITSDPGFCGSCDVTIRVVDRDGFSAVDTFRVSILKSYDFSGPGCYLISLPVEPLDTDITAVLDPSLNGKYDAVWAYAGGSWQGYFPGSPGFSDLTRMEAGRGYWISINQAAQFFTLGSSVQRQSIQLVPDWNLVGYNSLLDSPVSNALASIAGQYLSVWTHVDNNWNVYDPLYDNPYLIKLNQMQPGYGYWINRFKLNGITTEWKLQ